MPAELHLPAEDLLPQKGEMCLLERVLAADDEHLIATAVFQSSSLFCREGEIGAWVSLECMAQAVAAWAGYQGRQRGLPPKIGFLLGTRRFDCLRPTLPLNRVLHVEIHKEIEVEEGLGQFTGKTCDGDEVLATAVITVFSPEDPAEIIREARHV